MNQRVVPACSAVDMQLIPIRLLTCFGKCRHDDGECSAVGAQYPGHGWSNSCLAWLARQLNKSAHSYRLYCSIHAIYCQ